MNSVFGSIYGLCSGERNNRKTYKAEVGYKREDMRIYEFMSTLKIARMEEPEHVNRRQKLNTFSLIQKT